jgi:ATP phosphoribosyltransferase
MSAPLTLALPKGRLTEQVLELMESVGLKIEFEKRKLVAHDAEGKVSILLVKNADLPVYVHHGIAGLGVCGEDVLYEHGFPFVKLHTFGFGSTAMCLAGRKGESVVLKNGRMTVASKFTRFARDYFHERGIPVEVVKLNGSVELAPVLGLTPYIVDLVETGNTLKANDLEVLEKLSDIRVQLVANPAYFKLRFQEIRDFVDTLSTESI